VDLSPAGWPAGELDRYRELTGERGQSKAVAEADTAMVTGTTGAIATRAGLEALRQGGTAADAAITTALTQIAMAAGAWVSYAGFMNMIYYDAASKRVHTLHAGFGTPRGETDPASIPACTQSSGRTALVPGFFAGVQAAHDRFGKLPFDQLFAPAIYLAEQGFPVTGMVQGMLQYRKDMLLRRPDTRAIFAKNDSTMYAAGDTLRQTALAATLRRVAAEGADYIYRGDWARQLVDAVRAEGGKMAVEDLAAYEAIWGEPGRATYRGYELLGTPWPNFGAT
jgi:gamma-glutamyltranspeptidase/glutathione hydrolase